eukprot:TRINITY_DN9307_c0_g1_i1.p2 TRINITY_DN9307_c0_g1~~TRINITY_DN9307_c0_g1_i1.p2  ORF type:complete len:94 (-),score=17.66 TRINITY_DN9307_c0_g1_i1:24-305(-)
MSAIHWKSGKSTFNRKIKDGVTLQAGDTAEVTWVPQKPLCVTPYTECKGLARIAVMDGGGLVMLGKIVKVNYSGSEQEKVKQGKGKRREVESG